VKYQIAKNLTS